MELCGCGRPVRYSKHGPDGKMEHSCNKYKRCPTYEELRNVLDVTNRRLLVMVGAVERIDDYFDNSAESKDDQKKVHQILGNMADSLKAIEGF